MKLVLIIKFIINIFKLFFVFKLIPQFCINKLYEILNCLNGFLYKHLLP